jgi:hypothetical protein
MHKQGRMLDALLQTALMFVLLLVCCWYLQLDLLGVCRHKDPNNDSVIVKDLGKALQAQLFSSLPALRLTSKAMCSVVDSFLHAITYRSRTNQFDEQAAVVSALSANMGNWLAIILSGEWMQSLLHLVPFASPTLSSTFCLTDPLEDDTMPRVPVVHIDTHPECGGDVQPELYHGFAGDVFLCRTWCCAHSMRAQPAQPASEKQPGKKQPVHRTCW